MSIERVAQVIEISLTIFALIFIGVWLRKKKVLTPEQLGGINWILFNLSLPALLLRSIAPQDFSSLYQPAIIVGSLIPIVMSVVVFLGLSPLVRVRRPLKGPFVAGVFWANATYIGFPLAFNAFGETGLVNAAIVNAFVMPAFVTCGVLLYTFVGNEGESFSLRNLLKSIFNPIINSVVLGLLISWGVSTFGAPSGWSLRAVLQVDRVLEPLGQLGLPMALIAVGASLDFHSIRGKWMPLFLSVFGKLVLTPLACFLLIRWVFPNCEREALGVAVLIMATPCSVASFVVSRKMGVEPEFVSAQMVTSTMLSVISLPVWLYILV